MVGFVGNGLLMPRPCVRGKGNRCVVRAGVRENVSRVGGLIAAAVLSGFGSSASVNAAQREIHLLEMNRERTELVADGRAEILDDGAVITKRRLRDKRIAKYSNAQSEIIDLEREWEQLWYIRFLQYAMVICVVPTIGLSAAGLGKLFEAWTKAQEEAEREEEIKLTGSYSNPATVRKEKNEEDNKPKDADPKAEGGAGKKPKQGDDGDGGKSDGDDDAARDALERMFGKS